MTAGRYLLWGASGVSQFNDDVTETFPSTIVDVLAGMTGATPEVLEADGIIRVVARGRDVETEYAIEVSGPATGAHELDVVYRCGDAAPTPLSFDEAAVAVPALRSPGLMAIVRATIEGQAIFRAEFAADGGAEDIEIELAADAAWRASLGRRLLAEGLTASDEWLGDLHEIRVPGYERERGDLLERVTLPPAARLERSIVIVRVF